MKKIVLIVLLILGLSGYATAQEKLDTIYIEVVVNVVDSTSTHNINKHLDEANKILKQAGIELVLVKTNNPVNYGNNDSSLTREERDKARDHGREELDKACGKGKGIKVTLTDTPMEGKTATGVAIHENSTVIVKPRSDNAATGRTIAHEVGHSLTLNYDFYDEANKGRLMYGVTGGGTKLTDDEIKEIRKRAKQIAKEQKKAQKTTNNKKATSKTGQVTNKFGHQKDSRQDLIIFPPDLPIDPGNPILSGFDLRGTDIFWDPGVDPLLVNIRVQPQGLLPGGDFTVDSFFDVFYQIELIATPGGLPDRIVNIHAFKDISMPEPIFDCQVIDPISGTPLIDLPVLPTVNLEIWSGGIDPGVEPANVSLAVDVPLPVLFDPIDFKRMEDVVFQTTVHGVIILPDIPGEILIQDLPEEPGVFDLDQDICRPEISVTPLNFPTLDPSIPILPPLPSEAVLIVEGCGFNGTIDVRANTLPVATVSDGSQFRVFLGAEALGPYLPEELEILVQETDESLPKRNWAVINLDILPEIPGDINMDGRVDILDFEELSHWWLYELIAETDIF